MLNHLDEHHVGAAADAEGRTRSDDDAVAFCDACMLQAKALVVRKASWAFLGDGEARGRGPR